MTLSSSLQMPGAFHADGIHQGLLRPPVSPASSSGYLSQGRPTDLSTPKRKRPRESAVGHDEGSSKVLITPASGRTYRLAGRLDNTPVSGPEASGILSDSMFSDSDFRRALGSKRVRDDDHMADYKTPTPLFNLPSEPLHTSPSWGSVAVNTIGGVVGKVWEFCKAGAFRGFHAGGGRGYDMQPGDGMFPPEPQPWRQSEDDDEQVQMRIPGHFPRSDALYHTDDVAKEPHVDSGTSTPTTPAAKRRQTAPADDLGRNWVMVKDQNSTPRRATPRNRNEGPSMASRRRISTPNDRKPASPAPFVNSPRPYLEPSPFSAEAGARPPSSASFASPRSQSPTKSANRPIFSPGTASPARSGHRRRRSTNLPTSSSYGHARTLSNASTASSRGGARVEDVGNSPRLDREAKQLAARRQREERDADVRISAFNKQLQDMIRQGREALGTTVEVDGDGDGGAWEDYD